MELEKTISDFKLVMSSTKTMANEEKKALVKYLKDSNLGDYSTILDVGPVGRRNSFIYPVPIENPMISVHHKNAICNAAKLGYGAPYLNSGDLMAQIRGTYVTPAPRKGAHNQYWGYLAAIFYNRLGLLYKKNKHKWDVCAGIPANLAENRSHGVIFYNKASFKALYDELWNTVMEDTVR